MSEENVEVARRVIEALDRWDIPAAMKDSTTDFAFDFSRSLSPEQGVYGRDDIPQFAEDFAGIWESVRFEPEFIEAGDLVITPITTYSRGRDGIELPTRFAWLWSFRNGQVQRITFFQDGGEALEAAGFSE